MVNVQTLMDVQANGYAEICNVIDTARIVMKLTVVHYAASINHDIVNCLINHRMSVINALNKNIAQK